MPVTGATQSAEAGQSPESRSLIPAWKTNQYESGRDYSENKGQPNATHLATHWDFSLIATDSPLCLLFEVPLPEGEIT